MPQQFTSYSIATWLAVFIASQFSIAKKWKQPKCSLTHGEITKSRIYTYWECYLTVTKMEFTGKCMDLEMIIL